MNTEQKQYYYEMQEKGRLFPVKINGRLVCIFTFYIGEVGDLWNFVNDDPWVIIKDKDIGNLCYISQLLTDKHKDNPKLSYGVWKSFKNYIRKEFPSVEMIYFRRWNRHKEKVDIFIKKLKQEVKNESRIQS